MRGNKASASLVYRQTDAAKGVVFACPTYRISYKAHRDRTFEFSSMFHKSVKTTRHKVSNLRARYIKCNLTNTVLDIKARKSRSFNYSNYNDNKTDKSKAKHLKQVLTKQF